MVIQDLLKNPEKRAEWVYGQPMTPCPKCGSYNMKPQMPISMATTGDETMPQLLGKWAHATKAGTTPLEGPCYYACFDCGHKGPAVDCAGRTREDARQDRALNAEMKRLWNTQTPNALAQASGAGREEETTGACTASPGAMGSTSGDSQRGQEK